MSPFFSAISTDGSRTASFSTSLCVCVCFRGEATARGWPRPPLRAKCMSLCARWFRPAVESSSPLGPLPIARCRGSKRGPSSTATVTFIMSKGSSEADDAPRWTLAAADLRPLPPPPNHSRGKSVFSDAPKPYCSPRPTRNVLIERKKRLLVSSVRQVVCIFLFLAADPFSYSRASTPLHRSFTSRGVRMQLVWVADLRFP